MFYSCVVVLALLLYTWCSCYVLSSDVHTFQSETCPVGFYFCWEEASVGQDIIVGAFGPGNNCPMASTRQWSRIVSKVVSRQADVLFEYMDGWS